MFLEVGHYERILGHAGGAVLNAISTLIKEALESSLNPFAT